MSTKRRFKKANSLHVQMIFAMLLASIIPLLIVLVQMMNGYREQETKPSAVTFLSVPPTAAAKSEKVSLMIRSAA